MVLGSSTVRTYGFGKIDDVTRITLIKIYERLVGKSTCLSTLVPARPATPARTGWREVHLLSVSALTSALMLSDRYRAAGGRPYLVVPTVRILR